MTREYYQQEFTVCMHPDHEDYCMPPIGAARRVLDVGCGASIPSWIFPSTKIVGIDMDPTGFDVAREWGSEVEFHQASGEHIPFGLGTFDMVISRVALAYMDAGKALPGFYAALDPGGRLWLSLIGWRHWVGNLWRSILKPRKLGFQLYVLANSLLFHFTLIQFRFPGTRKMEWFQTDAGIRRALTNAGFVDIDIKHGKHYEVNARKL